MQLRRLRLRNIRSYERADLVFGSGTTLVSGDVGSGKTSLLYAIEMALFGFAEVEAAYLVRHLAADAEVRLSLADETHQYELVRRFARRSRRGKETFELEENSFSADGATRGYSTTELRQRAIDLLGFPDNPNPRAHSDLWRWAVYVPQERMREVLDQKPEDRLETVRKALGLEQYRTAADNALDVAAELRRAADVRSAEAERMAHWTDDLPRWTSTGQERQEELDQARPAERRTRDQLVEAEERLNEVELELKAFLIRESERARLSEESKRLARQAVDRRRIAHERRSESEKIRARAEEAQAIADGSEDARATETRLIGEREGVRNQLRALEAVRQALAAARSEVGAAETAERSAAASWAEAQREQTRLLQSLGEVTREEPVEEPREPTPATLGAIETQLQLTESELEQAQRESSVLEIEVAEVEELLRAGVCPRCKQAVSAGDFGAHREEARLQLANSDERRNRLRTTRDGLRADRARRETYERLHERWGQLEGRRSLAREAIASGDARSRRTRELLDESRTRLTAAKTRVLEMDRLAQPYADLEATLSVVESRLVSATQAVQSSAQAGERARAMIEQALLLESEAVRLTVEASDSDARKAEVDARLAEIDRDRPRSEETRQRSVGMKADVARLRSDLETSSRAIGRLESQLDEATRRVVEARQGLDEQRRLSGIAEHHRLLALWLARPFREALLKLEHRLLSRAQDEFDRSFARFFSTLIEDPALVARCDVAFTPLVEIEGEWTPPEALSGGERTALALAYRLALGQVVRSAGRLKLDTLILDEPTDGFSPEQVTRMGELLEEIAIPQVILVSHEGGLASVADRVIRVRKEGGLSVIEGGDGPSPGETLGGGEPTTRALPLDGATGKRRRTRVPRLDSPAVDRVSPGTP